MKSHNHARYWIGVAAGVVLVLAGLGLQHWKQRIVRAQLDQLERREKAMRAAVQRPGPAERNASVSTTIESSSTVQRATFSEPALSASNPLTWVAAANMADAGRATPLAAIETMLWAASRQDVDALAGMIDLEGQNRELAEKFLQQLPAAAQSDYGTPERLLALLIANDAPVGVELYSVAPNPDSGDTTVAGLAQMPDGHPQFVSYSFHQTPSGWAPAAGNQWVSNYVKSLSGGTVSLPPVVSQIKGNFIPPPTLPDPEK